MKSDFLPGGKPVRNANHPQWQFFERLPRPLGRTPVILIQLLLPHVLSIQTLLKSECRVVLHTTNDDKGIFNNTIVL